jgi:ATP-dependent 26S proteasome regulatory subunit
VSGMRNREFSLVIFSSRALTRPGRFDRHIAVPLPDIRGRVQILQQYMKDVKSGKGKQSVRRPCIPS